MEPPISNNLNPTPEYSRFSVSHVKLSWRLLKISGGKYRRVRGIGGGFSCWGRKEGFRDRARQHLLARALRHVLPVVTL